MDLEKILNQLMFCLEKGHENISNNKKIAYAEGYLDCLINTGIISWDEFDKLMEKICEDF